MQGTGLVALCACASVLQPATASVAGGASSIIVDITKEAASADHATAMHGTSARRAEEPLAAWLARLDDWQPVAGGASEVPASGTVDVVCSVGAETFRLRFDDPRVVSFQGEGGMLPSAQRLVVLPSAFLGDKAAATCDVRTAFYHETDVFARAEHGFAVLADTLTDAVPRTEKRVGPPSEVHNLVILAAGYTAAERTKWEADLAKAIDCFVNPPGEKYVNHMPLYRYFDAVNVFSVWQPSPESGATIPPGPVVNNNLGCSYGTAGIDRLLDCDERKLLALAETTDAKPRSENPRSVVVMTLVNSEKYGGSGSYSSNFKRGTFYAPADTTQSGKETFAAIMFHELGHAWVDLADEYNSESGKGQTDGQNTNCVGPDFLNNLPWQHLIDAGLVPATPSLGCTYANWYRAKPSCLMLELEQKELCPVCREKMTLSLYDTPTFSTTWPSCPLPNEIVHVAVGGSVRLHANSKLVLKDNFNITWELVPAGGGAAVALCQQCGADLEVSASALQAGLNTVRLTVSDTTPWVFTKPAAMTQSRTFTLKVVDSVDTANLRSRRCYCADESGVDCRGGASFFSNAGASDVAYYSECVAASGECELHTTTYEKSLRTSVGSPTSAPTSVLTDVPTSVPTNAPSGGVPAFPSVCGASQEVLPTSGTLAHPASGSEYKNDENLCWMLQCDQTATLDWLAFVTESSYDFVEVYALGSNGQSSRVFRESGTGANNVQHDGTVVVRFTSDDSQVHSGFRAAYACAPAFTSPTDVPTSVPTSVPTEVSTSVSTDVPTSVPTSAPTSVSTDVPTSVSTDVPTSVSTDVPTSVPTSAPTSVSTDVPTSVSTDVPTSVSTDVPTSVPTSAPTSVSTDVPTSVSTDVPTSVSTDVPTSVPTSVPTDVPTSIPTSAPTSVPTDVPTDVPTSVPAELPASVPTDVPMSVPTSVPTSVPAAAFTFPTDCGDKYALSGAEGTVEHPAGSGKYGVSESKCWHVPCTSTLQLTWTQFETESGYDHVTLYKEAGLQEVWRKSGMVVPAAWTISGGAMLRFKSDHSVNGPGFTVSWTCGRVRSSVLMDVTTDAPSGSASKCLVGYILLIPVLALMLL